MGSEMCIRDRHVFIDGAEAFVRGEKQTQPVTDFDLGIINPSDERASL